MLTINFIQLKMFSLLTTASFFFAGFGVTNPAGNDVMPPLYIECLMNHVKETGKWSDECEREMEKEAKKGYVNGQ